MTPLILSKLDEAHLRTLGAVRYIVNRIPDDVRNKSGKAVTLSCHHVARVVASKLPELACVDGNVLRGYTHSWLLTQDQRFIIDAYPWVAYPGPLLLDYTGLSPWRQIYNPGIIIHTASSSFAEEMECILRACV